MYSISMLSIFCCVHLPVPFSGMESGTIRIMEKARLDKKYFHQITRRHETLQLDVNLHINGHRKVAEIAGKGTRINF